MPGLEIPAAAFRERFQRDAVTEPFDEYDGTLLLVHASHLRGPGKPSDDSTVQRPGERGAPDAGREVDRERRAGSSSSGRKT
jgi:hypothetical protein